MEDSERAAGRFLTNRERQNEVENAASLVDNIDSVALARLMEEVRIQEPVMGKHYDRTYNRHNR